MTEWITEEQWGRGGVEESYTPGDSSYESPILSTTPMSQKHTPTLANVNV